MTITSYQTACTRKHVLTPLQVWRFVAMTDSNPEEPIYPNLAKDLEPTGLGQRVCQSLQLGLAFLPDDLVNDQGVDRSGPRRLGVFAGIEVERFTSGFGTATPSKQVPKRRDSVPEQAQVD